MNILILGYGLEGKSSENYFKQDPRRAEHVTLDILDNFSKEELLFKDFSQYDLIFRTPSIPPKFIPAPKEKITSVTKFFFSNCPCPIIGVTGTKGKGTTCTLIRDILNSLLVSYISGKEPSAVAAPKTFLLGNIGAPALDVLPELTPDDVVIYELSSFQLWDLTKSPGISVVLRLEPDHLDVHDSIEEYYSAKSNICIHQSPADFCVYFKDNLHTRRAVKASPAQKLPFPLSTKTRARLDTLLSVLKVPGKHNAEDAEAALLAVYAYYQKYLNYQKSFDAWLTDFEEPLKTALKNFRPLPHHIEFVRELNGVTYYDDSFSTVFPSLEAALNSFPRQPLVLIAGGKDKGFDLTPAKRAIFDKPNLVKAILIGETAQKLASGEDPTKFVLCGKDFELAVKTAQTLAEAKLASAEMNSDTCLVDAKPKIPSPVVLLSPCASSFDMFESYKQRGDIFKQLVNSLN